MQIIFDFLKITAPKIESCGLWYTNFPSFSSSETAVNNDLLKPVFYVTQRK